MCARPILRLIENTETANARTAVPCQMERNYHRWWLQRKTGLLPEVSPLFPIPEQIWPAKESYRIKTKIWMKES